MARNQKDHFYKKAKAEGYRARSAYKLQQVNQKFRLIKKATPFSTSAPPPVAGSR